MKSLGQGELCGMALWIDKFCH